MDRHRALWFFISILILTSLACNAFAGQVEPGVPPPPTAVSETPPLTDATPGIAPTATLPGADAADSTAESEIGAPSATVLVDLNVRSGPGVQYDRVGFLLEGDVASILGVDPETGWWKIACPPTAEGSECWISGGEQYARASNADAVAAAQVPPTPTPAPPELEPGQGVLAYIDNGRLFAARLDLTQTPPALGEPRQLSDVGNVQRIALSPDGRRVAFVAGASQANSLSVVNVDGQGERTLVESTDLPVGVEGGASSFVALVDQVQWLADAQTLAFNTAFVNLSGPGVGSQVDLWTVGLDATPAARFPSGTGTGYLAISMNNTVLLSMTESLARINLDGSAGQIMVQFAQINTASEYFYFPQPQWTAADGAYVAVPDADPWSAGSGATLWQIPEQGAAVQLGRLDGNILFNPVAWTRDGSRLAYVQTLMDRDSAAPALIVANANGQNAVMVSEAPQVRFLGWSPNRTDFAYAAQDFYAIGRVDGAEALLPLAPGQVAGAAQWASETAVVVAVGFPESNAWRLTAVDTAGTTRDLLDLSGSEAVFEVWSPVG